MPAFDVTTSEVIEAPLQKVHDAIVDFHTWPTWSPWLFMEPGCSLEYRGTTGEKDHGYGWRGNKIGAGDMTLLDAGDASNSQHRTVNCDLQFIKPFKSQASVGFVLEALEPSSTKITWTMNSSLPFFMFFMVKKMVAMIRNDYDRGLRLLKEYVETGDVHMSVEHNGVVDVPASSYHGVSSTTTMAGVHDSMQSSYSTLMSGLTDSSVEADGAPFSIYTDTDFVNDRMAYIAAVPTKGDGSVAGAQRGERAACRAVKVTQHGSYSHLANGWAMAMGELRFAKLKPNKTIKPFEIYLNDPDQTPEQELITEIYVPIR
ncbi:MAG: SRPBCC family protein [Gammaproteobacteria bacterium]|nr:SRPBCC family protein [Gammaproteobacteria bacterium]